MFFLATAITSGEYKGAFRHHPVRNAIEASAFITANAHEKDIWHAYAAFETEGIPRPNGQGYRRRVNDNVKSLRCFVWDIDLGADEKKHDTAEEALAELERWCEITNMPWPTDIVSSGGGLHVYWVIDRELSRENWVNVASRIKVLAIRHGGKLAADTTRISDAAGVLRPVGTFNHKAEYGEPRPVEWLEDNGVLPARDLIQPLEHIDPVIKAPMMRTNMVAPLWGQFLCAPPRTQMDFRELVVACPQVQRHIQARGQVSEPDWYALAQLLGYVKHGRELFHKLSAGDTRYNYADADNKFTQVFDLDKGPTTCTQMAAVETDGGSTCEGCPFYNRARNPSDALNQLRRSRTRQATEVKVERAQTEETAADELEEDEDELAVIPTGYSIMTGKLEKEVHGDEGETYWQVISDHIIYMEDVTDPGQIGSSEASTIYVRTIQKLEDGTEIDRSTPLPAKCLATVGEFYKAALEHGLPVTEPKAIHEYLGHCRAALLRRRSNTRLTEQFGWMDKSHFATGVHMLSKDHVRKVQLAPAIKAAGTYLSSRSGTLAEWSNIFNSYVDGIDQNQQTARDVWGAYGFVAMTGFAAPLMRMTGQRCLTLSLEGASGIGKSAAMRLASSVWGKPNENTTKASDTVNYREQVIAAHGSLPILYDEVTVEDDDYLREFIMKMTQGTGRNRLNSNADMRTAMHEWHTMVVMSANKEVSRMIRGRSTAANAEQYRLLPVPMKRSGWYDPARMRAMFRDLDNHHGLAGEVYVKRVLSDYDGIEKRVIDRMDRLSNQIDDDGAGRFWCAGTACILVAAEITEELGMSRMKPGLLDYWATEHLEKTNRQVRGSKLRPEELINATLSDYIDRIVQVTIQDGRAMPSLGGGMTRSLMGRLETHKQGNGNVLKLRSYIRASSIDKAMQDRAMHVNQAMAELGKAGILLGQPKMVNLTEGTNLPPVTVKCYCFDHAALVGMDPAEAAASMGEPKAATHVTDQFTIN